MSPNQRRSVSWVAPLVVPLGFATAVAFAASPRASDASLAIDGGTYAAPEAAADGDHWPLHVTYTVRWEADTYGPGSDAGSATYEFLGRSRTDPCVSG